MPDTIIPTQGETSRPKRSGGKPGPTHIVPPAEPKAKEKAKRQKTSYLDKAEQVLAASDEPLSIYEIMKRAKLKQPEGAKLYNELKESDDYVKVGPAIFDLKRLNRKPPEKDKATKAPKKTDGAAS